MKKQSRPPPKASRVATPKRRESGSRTKTAHATRNTQHAPPPSRRRGKIAHLPQPLREEVNLLIQDHASSSKIIAFLEERGHPGVNEVNITHWIRGDRSGSSGYNDWLLEREQLLAMRARREFAFDVVRQGGGPQIHEATRLMAAAQLSEVIIGFDVQKLKAALHANPVAFASLVTALRRLSHDNLAYQKYRSLVEAQKETIRQALGKVKGGGLTPETIQQMHEAVARM